MKFASRLDEVKPSATLEITARAKALKEKGVDVVSFTAGEPDFPTPSHICEAAHEAIRTGKTRYLPTAGLPALRNAVARDYSAQHHVKVEPEQVVITVGAKQALFNFFLAALEPGDEVIIPAPYWVSYPDQVRIAEGVPVIVETRASDHFRLRPDAVLKAATGKTKVLVLNSPSNPTGAVYPSAELKAILDVARTLGVWVVSDEIYSRLVYGGIEYASALSTAPDLADRIVVVDGTSKTFSMTGWRVGWAIAPKKMASTIAMLQGQSTSNPTSFAQYGALAAIESPKDFFKAWLQEFEHRRNTIVEALNQIPHVTCSRPDGAFYAFADFSYYSGEGGRKDAPFPDDQKLAQFLLDKAQVAVIPGSAFGAPGFQRLTYATSVAEIEKGVGRIRSCLCDLPLPR